LTVSTTAVNKPYDATTAAPGATALVTSGVLAAGDSLVGGGFTFVDPNAGTGKTVTVSGVTVNDGNGGTNYTVTQIGNTTSSISAANLTLSTSDVIKTYDGTNSAAGVLLVTSGSMFASDTFGGGSFTFTDKIVGSSNKTVTVGGVTINDGNGGANYNVGYAANNTSTINKADLTSVTGIVASNKVYDGNNVAALVTGAAGFAGIFSGDVLTVASASGIFSDRNVGTAKPVSISAIALGGADAGNHNLLNTTANGSANITPANLSISTGTVSKTYDGTTDAAGTAIVTSGALFGADQISGGIFAFLDPNAGAGKTVTVSGVTVNDGNGGANYTVTPVNNTSSSISALDKANWNGLGGNSLWSNPANWDVLPTTGNVFAVIIPAVAGTVVFDASAVNTVLQSLSSAQPISVTGGSLILDSTLDTPSLSQTGGNLQVGTILTTSNLSQSAGTLQVGTGLIVNNFSQSGGTINGSGALEVSGSFSQSPSASISLGSIKIKQSAGDLVIANLSAPVIALAAPAGMIGQTGLISGAALSTSSRSGTVLNHTANQIGALVASNTGSGTIALVNSGALSIGSMANAAGNIDVTNTGAITTVGPVTAPTGNIGITANSPLTVGAGGISASGNITLVATNLTSAGNLTLDGALYAGDKVGLKAGGNLVQNFAVVGINGVTATAQGSATYGPFATTNFPTILYTAGGIPVAPPPAVLSSTLQAPGDIIVTFLDQFQQTVNGRFGDLLETNPDGSKKRKELDGIVAEGDICR
jgi:hypothetical protein